LRSPFRHASRDIRITIAAVNGPAMSLGLDGALACDFIIAAPEAQFAASFVKRGLIPDGGGLYFLRAASACS
jgi:2-(1,2-epoxy-1,2-dihydrophenyl)acetyl-CoA isomerase